MQVFYENMKGAARDIDGTETFRLHIRWNLVQFGFGIYPRGGDGSRDVASAPPKSCANLSGVNTISGGGQVDYIICLLHLASAPPDIDTTFFESIPS